MELILRRYAIPPSANSDGLLARYEASLFDELSATLASAPHHRSDVVNRSILPRCRAFVEAIGHRMAYDAAVAAGVSPALVDLFVARAMKLDPAWFVEEAGIGRAAQATMEESALDAVLPHVERLVGDFGAEPYLTAPIVSDAAWDTFVEGLPVYRSAEHGQDSLP
jgi:acyl-CoA oxidase